MANDEEYWPETEYGEKPYALIVDEYTHKSGRSFLRYCRMMMDRGGWDGLNGEMWYWQMVLYATFGIYIHFSRKNRGGKFPGEKREPRGAAEVLVKNYIAEMKHVFNVHLQD